MTGTKGTGGPVPKRSDQRRRRNAPAKAITKASADPLTVVNPLRANVKWHATAKRWYNSLEKSGQAAFYQESDWATAYLLAESISRELKPQVIGTTDAGRPIMAELPPKGASLAAWLKGMTSLLATEGDRRRAALELQNPTAGGPGEGDADVSELDEYRNRLRRQSP